MDRLACVDLGSFPLQILERRHRDWSGRPTALVSCDTPQGEVLQVNRAARTFGIRSGSRYACALSLCPELCAGVVTEVEIEKAAKRVVEILGRFSPKVEPKEDEPGVFWLDPSGMGRLYETPKRWASSLVEALAEDLFLSSVAVGFTRFGTYALARSSRGVTVMRTPKQERNLCDRTPLSFLGVSPSARDDLEKLGVVDLAQLLALPPCELLLRFGEEVHRLHRMAEGEHRRPLKPLREKEAVVERFELDLPDASSTRLTFLAKRLLAPLLGRVADRKEALSALEMALALDHEKDVSALVCPAQPTLDEAQLIDLVRLKLEALPLKAGVTEMVLVAHTVQATEEQLNLFSRMTRRDPEAARRALARIRARWGERSVAVAESCDGHLPEARFRWVFKDPESFCLPGDSRSKEAPSSVGSLTLVRRIHHRPIPMQGRPVAGPGGVHLRGMDDEPVYEIIGPYTISGGWWHKEIHRDYYFAKTKSEKILWVYYDKRRRRWFLQGEVE